MTSEDGGKVTKAEYDRRYRAENAERRREIRRAYQATWNAMRREKTRLYRLEHPRKAPQTREERLEKMRSYHAKNREKANQASRNYYAVNAERLRELAKENYAKDPTSWMARNNRRTKERMKTDHAFRTMVNLLRGCSRFLRGTIKSARWRDLIGCDLAALKAHLESKFTEGMSWENYGGKGWQVDHIVPLSSFDMSDPEQQKKAFHYTNTQPLWRLDNIRKSNKI